MVISVMVAKPTKATAKRVKSEIQPFDSQRMQWRILESTK